MQLTKAYCERIAHCFPKHRGSLTYSNLQVLNAILYIAENGAKWRRLPKEFGHWHTVYARMRGWARQGVLARVFEAMRTMRLVQIKVEVCSLDSTPVKVHPDGTEALKKTGRNPSDVPAEDSQPRFIWLPQMSGRPSVSRSRRDRPRTDPKGASSSKAGRRPAPATQVGRDGQGVRGQRDAPVGARLGAGAGGPPPPKKKADRLNPWDYDRELYKRRNEVERLFRRLKAFRRIFSRFEKLDEMFTAFVHFALVADALIYINTP